MKGRQITVVVAVILFSNKCRNNNAADALAVIGGIIVFYSYPYKGETENIRIYLPRQENK